MVDKHTLGSHARPAPPEQMTTLKLIRLFVRYASTHRRRLILLLWPPMLIERFKLETLLHPATNEPPIL